MKNTDSSIKESSNFVATKVVNLESDVKVLDPKDTRHEIRACGGGGGDGGTSSVSVPMSW